MEYEDCYFYHNKEENKIKPICLKCFSKNPIQEAWHWKGSTMGYGPFKFKCDFCENIIYDYKKEA